MVKTIEQEVRGVYERTLKRLVSLGFDAGVIGSHTGKKLRRCDCEARHVLVYMCGEYARQRGISFRDVANIIGCSHACVYASHARVRQALKGDAYPFISFLMQRIRGGGRG